MINRVFKNIKVLIISIVFAILFCVNASAFSTNLKEIKVLESNFEVTDPVIEGNNITNNITFNNKDDYVVFELTLKNNDIIKYTIDSIEDNNTNKNLVLSYDYQNKIVDKNSEFKVKVKLHYKNRLENVERIDEQFQAGKDERKKTFKRIKEMQKLIKKKSEMANHCM